MVGHSGAGGAPEIEPDVEPLGPIFALQSALAALGELEQLVELLELRIAQKRDVPVQDDENVTGAVREEVEYHKCALPAAQQEILRVTALGEDPAEHTSPGGVCRKRADVVKTPRRPETVHY
jgi:hypothetical protein